MGHCSSFCFSALAKVLVAVALVMLQGAVAENRCGAGWADANGKCGTLCPAGTDAACPSNEQCYGSLDACATPPSPTENRCGDGWADANGKCGTKCPAGTDAACPTGEQCYGQLDACGSSPPASGNGRCGAGDSDPLRCIAAHYNCANLCSSNADCSGGATCEDASASCTDSTPPGTSYATLNSEQLSNARTIIGVGKGNDIEERGWEVALVTAMQESFLLNLGCGDEDSVGLFQQRPEFSWGTAAQIQDPVLSAEAFYGVAAHTGNPGLLTLTKAECTNWEGLSLGEAAQCVQVAEAGNLYEQWAGLASDIVSDNMDAPAIT